MSFTSLQLIAPLLRAVADEGYVEPTPIQNECIPHVLAGRDLLGCAQTGTGKTAAFALPILQRLALNASARGKRPIRALVLAPTRELASQVADSFKNYGRGLDLSVACVFGGVGQNPQVLELRRGVDVLVATPGRLLDLASQGEIVFSQLEVLVLDEADRMLDMGFLPDVRRIIARLPKRRQTLLYSATMPSDIRALANQILVDPVHVAVTPVASTVDKIDQSVFFVAKSNKRALLEHVLQQAEMDRVLVFTRTKHGANRVVKDLTRAQIPALAIHGNKSQSARERALSQFKKGETRVLVATDIAARGLDVEGISHVVNFDLPEVAESYVHRIGRTARAGAGGTAYSFCDADEHQLLRAIERLIRMRVTVVTDHPHAEAEAQPREAEPRRDERGGARPAQGHRPARVNVYPRQGSTRDDRGHGAVRKQASSDALRRDEPRRAPAQGQGAHRAPTPRDEPRRAPAQAQGNRPATPREPAPQEHVVEPSTPRRRRRVHFGPARQR